MLKSMSMKIKQGELAPDFTLLDQDGREHTLSKLRGKLVLLYFYPKDDTPGCTMEACSFRDHFPKFEKLKISVFGISVDSVQSHAKFVQKYRLPFTLLSDEDQTVVNAYGVWEKKTFRTSFLIDPDGRVAKVYENVKPETHVDEVLSDSENFITLHSS